ncbi:hypothetical protein [Microbacterium thalli]|uniref:Uncharacterized protein n=1 Tax=Microbacterium thalli TaxID=3027921 RepID=A0ABT5SFC0_9MICO|nr:hypothetical protein [Microbacterium thalli]MDD7960931.1 hypothetical protein [Microbacterium thalli]
MTQTRHALRAQRARRRSTRGAALRLAAAAGMLAFGAISISAAALADSATLGLGANGIGFEGRFAIGTVSLDGTVEQVIADGPAERPIPEAALLVPGGSISIEIPVFNNTERLAADTTVTVVAAGGDGAVADVPNITPYLRFTAVDPAGNELFSAATWDEATGSLGVLAPRGDLPLTDGDAFAPGAEGSAQTLVLTIDYLDEPGTEELNGGLSALSVRFDATSVRP